MNKPIDRRMTEQRRVILEELRNVENHPTAEELFDIVRERLPRVSLGTVYRNLDLLSRTGEVLKLDMGPSRARFDGTTAPHYHVRCVECGRLDDVVQAPVTIPHDYFDGLGEYMLLGHRLEFQGLCGECQKRRQYPERRDGFP